MAAVVVVMTIVVVIVSAVVAVAVVVVMAVVVVVVVVVVLIAVLVAVPAILQIILPCNAFLTQSYLTPAKVHRLSSIYLKIVILSHKNSLSLPAVRVGRRLTELR